MTIRVSDLRKTFPGDAGPVRVLDGIDLVLERGETLALTGESGSGKSTLLAILATLEGFDSGSVSVDGQELAQLNDAARAQMRRERIGVVFQQFNLIPSLTAADNIAFQAKLSGRWEPEWHEALIERLGLGDHQTKYPEQLSGGQQQRVAIGRTLAARPAYVLADEPTGNLDEDTSLKVLDLLTDLVAETNSGLLMVTHSSTLADRLGHRVHLSHGRLA